MKPVLKTRETTSVMIVVLTVKMLFTYPRYLVERCLNGAWLSVILYLVLSVGIFWVTEKLYLKTGRTSVINQAEAVGGRTLRAIVGIFSFAAMMLTIAPMVRTFPEAIKTVLLQNTDMLAIVAALAVGAYFGAYFGIEALGITASIFLPFAAFFILIFFILLQPHFALTNLFPFSFYDISIGNTSSFSLFSDIFVLNFLLPYIGDMKTVRKSGYIALIISGITGALIVLAYCLCYPYPSSSRFIVPLYQLARMVKIGTYFQRLESIFEFVWSISILIYCGIYLWVMCDIFKKSFALGDYKPLIMPVLVILLRFVFWEESYTGALRSDFVASNYLYPIMYLLPLLVGALYLRKRRRQGL